jgi:hypothetical protein
MSRRYQIDLHIYFNWRGVNYIANYENIPVRIKTRFIQLIVLRWMTFKMNDRPNFTCYWKSIAAFVFDGPLMFEPTKYIIESGSLIASGNSDNSER